MSLGRRTARQHETVASVRATAGVRSEDYWDFKPGQAVMTVDGFPGTVTAVQDGPFPGSEAYIVTLANGLGGGEYRAGELSPLAATTASTEHTAADDYPELGTVLVDRPDIAHNTVLASKTASAEDLDEDSCGCGESCEICGWVGGDPFQDGTGHECPKCHSNVFHEGSSKTAGYYDSPYDDMGPDRHDVSDDDDIVCPRCEGEGCKDCRGTGRMGTLPKNSVKTADMAEPPWTQRQCQSCGVTSQPVLGTSGSKECARCGSSSLTQVVRDPRQGSKTAEWRAVGPQGQHGHVQNIEGGRALARDLDGTVTEHPSEQRAKQHLQQHFFWTRDLGLAPPDRLASRVVAEVTHDYVVDQDRLLPKACSHCGADGSLVFAASVEDTGRGFRAICSNCKGQMVTSGYGMWNPALPSTLNQPSSAPSAPLPGFRWSSLQTQAVGPTCPNCRGDMEPEYAKQDSYRCPDCGVSGKPQERVESLPEHLRAASMLHLAAKDTEFHFHFTAAWSDVRSKAKRIRSEGGVHVVSVTGGEIVGEVKGDHHIYETQISTVPGRRAVAVWACACKWGSYAWGRSPAYKRFEGRMCSHALALHFEAQSRGMFGREIREDTQRPSWMRQRTPVVVHHDKDTDTNHTRRAVPPGNMRRTFSALDVEGVYDDDSLDLAHPPVLGMVEEMVVQGADPASLISAVGSLGYSHEDAKALLSMGTAEARKPHHKKRHHRQTHNVCAGRGCRGCGGRGWVGYGPGWGVGGWWGPYGGGVGNPQTADGVGSIGDAGLGGGAIDGGGGSTEASLQTTAAELHELDALHSQHEIYQGDRPAPGSDHHRDYVQGHREGYTDATVVNPAMKPEEVHSKALGDMRWTRTQNPNPKQKARAQGYLDGHSAGAGAGGAWHHLGAANDPLEEFTDPRDHRNRHLDNQENPASSGFASAPDAWPHFQMDTRVEPTGTYASLQTEALDDDDLETCSWCSDEVPDRSLRTTPDGARVCPHCWSHTEPAPGQRRASLDEALFEPDPTPQEQFAQGVAREYNRLEAEAVAPLVAPLVRALAPAVIDGLTGDDEEQKTAILEDEPAPALPQTEGDPNDPLSPGRMAVPPGPNSDGDVTDDEALAQYTGSIEDTVAAFQATAKHLEGGGRSQDSSDIAQAAQQALAKMALKEFTPAEQQALISEGADVRAANLDRLDIAGTHYEAVLAAVAAEEAADEDWMA